MSYIATVDGKDYEVDIAGPCLVDVDEAKHVFDLRAIDEQFLYSLLLDNRSYEVFVERRDGVYYVSVAGDRFAVSVEDARMKRLKEMGRKLHLITTASTVCAPMPGLVARVMVGPGQSVASGDGLLILEAMKMENDILAPMEGVVKSVHVQAGDTVNTGDVLLVMQ